MKKFLIPCLATFAAAFVALPLSAAELNQRYITTTGTVNIMIPADSAQLHISLSALGPTLEQSNRNLDAAIDTLQTELRARGIPAQAVTLKERDASKEWRDKEGRSSSELKKELIGYRTSARMIVSIDDIAKLSPLITYVGLNEQYSSYRFLRSSKIGEEKKAVLASALRIAHDKAQIIAKEGDAKLGVLLNASEEDVRNDDNRSMYNASINSASRVIRPGDANNDVNTATPVGDHRISINVRVRATFALE
jgi:uncharacterized protein YggE